MKLKSIAKLGTLFLAGALAASMFAGCGSSDNSSSSKNSTDVPTSPSADNVIRVGASPTPHAEILEQIKEPLKEAGFTLEIIEFNDYVQPNTALEEGNLDANYFQHITYLNDFNEQNNTHLINAIGMHFEPFGLYAGKTKSLDQLADGAKIAVPNDTTNEARALLLLEEQGLIKLKEGAGLLATKQDIVENSKNLEIQEVEAAQLPRVLAEVDMAAINGNYALQGGLNVKDALAVEGTASDAANAYINIIAIKEGNALSAKTQALIKAVATDEVRNFVKEKFNGAVVALF